MSEGLTVPASIEEIIQQSDASKEAIGELALSEKINRARHALDKPSEAENIGAWASAISRMLAY